MNKFVIEGRLPGLNEYTKANRSNKYMANKMKQDIQAQINDCIVRAVSRNELHVIDKYPVMIAINWYEPNSKRDIDNITFATKFIQDSMVQTGIIIDDSQKYIHGLVHHVEVDKEHPRIEVCFI